MAITLIKETGEGLADANTYADVSDLVSAAELLGYDISTYTVEQQKSALYVAANKYIDRLHTFSGELIDSNQAMKLYTDVATFDIASKDVIQANVEAAILHLKGFLFVDEESQSVNGDVIATTDKLDVLESSVTYSEGTKVRTKYNTSTIDDLLKPYIQFGSGGVQLRVV